MKDLAPKAVQIQSRDPSGEKHAVRMTNKGQTRSLGTEDVILSAAKDLAFGLPFQTTVESEPRSFPSGDAIGRKNSPQDDKSPKRRSQDDKKPGNGLQGDSGLSS